MERDAINRWTYRALVVDDEPIVRRRLLLCLNEEGFQCDTAEDGDQALAMLATSEYDMVVTDLKMPNKHGHALAVELLKMPDRPLIIVLTAVEDPRMVKDLMLRGVDDVMHKPVNHESFAAKVKAMVQRRLAHSTDRDSK